MFQEKTLIYIYFFFISLEKQIINKKTLIKESIFFNQLKKQKHVKMSIGFEV